MSDTVLGAPQIGRPGLGRIGTSREGVHMWRGAASARNGGLPALAVGLLHVPAGMSVRDWQAARGMVRLRTAQCGYRLLETFDITDHAIEAHEALLAVDRLVVETGAVALVVAGPLDSAQLRDLLVRSRAEVVRLPLDIDPDEPGPVSVQTSAREW